jgi:rubredoxin
MIKPFVTLFSFICLCFAAQSANAFQAPSLVRSSSVTSQTAINVFGNKKKVSAADEEKASKFWQGEWVCKDCGYIYSRAECAGLYFEEQTPGFRCPQCSGPRRRYAKKVGDVVGTTLDGGDAPILLFSFGGVIATIAFGIWAVNNL